LCGCGPSTRWNHTPDDYHVVRTGETLYTIAWRYGQECRELARWNDLGDGSLIHPGQVIRLNPPRDAAASRPAAAAAPASPRRQAEPAPPRRELPQIPAQPAPPWQWPTEGEVVVEFGSRPGSGTGLLIGGERGQPVRAAADGRVVYSGS